MKRHHLQGSDYYRGDGAVTIHHSMWSWKYVQGGIAGIMVTSSLTSTHNVQVHVYNSFTSMRIDLYRMRTNAGVGPSLAKRNWVGSLQDNRMDSVQVIPSSIDVGKVSIYIMTSSGFAGTSPFPADHNVHFFCKPLCNPACTSTCELLWW